MSKPNCQNPQWRRVIRTPIRSSEKARSQTINGTLQNETFIERCKLAGIKPTRRQASKYSRDMGLAKLVRKET